MAPDERTAALLRYLDEVFPDLELYSYYQLLEVPDDAAPAAIRAAYYGKAAELHPDRFPALGDDAARERLVTVYARIAEGYRILSDARKRAAYDEGLAAGRVRFGAGEREKKGPRNPVDELKTEPGKKFLRLALQARAAGDLKGAIMNVNFARSFEPDAEVLADLHGQLKEQAKGPTETGK